MLETRVLSGPVQLQKICPLNLRAKKSTFKFRSAESVGIKLTSSGYVSLDFSLVLANHLHPTASDANQAKVLSEGKRAILASVIETQDIKRACRIGALPPTDHTLLTDGAFYSPTNHLKRLKLGERTNPSTFNVHTKFCAHPTVQTKSMAHTTFQLVITYTPIITLNRIL